MCCGCFRLPSDLTSLPILEDAGILMSAAWERFARLQAKEVVTSNGVWLYRLACPFQSCSVELADSCLTGANVLSKVWIATPKTPS